MTDLSTDFTLEELIATNTGLSNNPGPDELTKLKVLATTILQPIRDRWGRVHVTSGFRSQAVNSAVGGVNTSQHVFGEAADIIPLDTDIDTVFKWIVRFSDIRFGQCINEMRGKSRWIHVSLERDGKPNRQALIYDGRTYKPYLYLIKGG